MKLAHLSGRFVGALWPGAPRADDVAWVESVLTPDGFVQFRRQPHHDQRHAIAVARDVQRRLAGTEYADDPRWLSAALLHDIGKLDSRLGVYGRVVATVSGSVAGRDHARAWSESRGFTRRVGLYLRHAELGADRIRLAGEPEEAARWAAAHHEATTWAELPIPAPVVKALDEADND
jgi:putative nucleotidyltransferase with HDIG domain